MFDLQLLETVEAGSFINELSKPKLTVLQRALSWLTYPISVVDGLFGPNTRNAWGEFKDDIGEGNPLQVSQPSLDILAERLSKINEILASDLSNKDRTVDAIVGLCDEMALPLKPQKAYVLATTQWETAHTFKPVKEAFWLSESWRKNNLRYYPYYGRGYVQLTWKRNYDKYSDILAQKLVDQPKLALREDISLFVLVHGCKQGTFTGRKIEDYINDEKTDLINARRVINDSDKAREIAELAESFLDDI